MTDHNDVQRDARRIVDVGLSSIDVKHVMSSSVCLDGDQLTVNHHVVQVAPSSRLVLVAGGKASLSMVQALPPALIKRIERGTVIGIDDSHACPFDFVRGTHPLPSPANVQGTLQMLESVRGLSKDDVVLALISGGASALWAAPVCSLETLRRVTKHLMRAGATIHQLNVVRKHLSLIKGGHLAKAAFPATVVSVIVSDVLDNDLSVIASGPTALDVSTVDDAREICRRFGWTSPLPFQETPKDPTLFENRVHNVVVLDNRVAVNAMIREARALGYRTVDLGTTLSGEARDLGKILAEEHLSPGIAAIGGGETTVTVTGNGQGGRNQEVALGALAPGVTFRCKGCIASVGTDGQDNGPIAGAIVDGSEPRAHVDGFLSNNDATTFFKTFAPNALIITGKTGTNVADVMICLGSKTA